MAVQLFKKILPLFVLTISIGIIFPNVAAAQTDSRCFTLNDCIELRKSGPFGLSEEEAKQNPLYQGIDAQKACGGTEIAIGKDVFPIGFCYPSTVAETQTSFGGTTSFANVGEFIQLMYRYGIVIAGIIALLVIMLAGFGWITSGGNTEVITSAKKKIAGALMGMFLASLSYFILNTVNPYLVNFRLPQTWLIQPQQNAPLFCEKGKGRLALALSKKDLEKSAAEQAQILEKKSKDPTLKFDVEAKEGLCGSKYIVEDSGGQSCLGSYCGPSPGQTFMCFQRPKDTPGCYKSNIVGMIYNSDLYADSFTGQLLSESWTWTWVKTIHLYAVCDDGSHKKVVQGGTANDDVTKTIFYTVRASDAQIDKAVKNCAGGSFKGFVLDLDMNEAFDFILDEDHWIGKIGNNIVDLGDNGAFSQTAKVPENKKYMLTAEELKKGVILNINAGLIHDVDIGSQSAQRRKFYGKFGYR